MRGPYRPIGVSLTRAFRQDQNQNLIDIYTDILSLTNQLQTLIINATGNSNPEVTAARIGEDGTTYASLLARLNAEYLKLDRRITVSVSAPDSPVAGDIWYKEV